MEREEKFYMWYEIIDLTWRVIFSTDTLAPYECMDPSIGVGMHAQ